MSRFLWFSVYKNCNMILDAICLHLLLLYVTGKVGMRDVLKLVTLYQYSDTFDRH